MSALTSRHPYPRPWHVEPACTEEGRELLLVWSDMANPQVVREFGAGERVEAELWVGMVNAAGEAEFEGILERMEL